MGHKQLNPRAGLYLSHRQPGGGVRYCIGDEGAKLPGLTRGPFIDNRMSGNVPISVEKGEAGIAG